MGNLTTIVAADAAATPVNHTYDPVKSDGTSVSFIDSSASNSLGYRSIGLSLRLPLAGQTEKIYRTRVSHSMPVTYDETINGVTRPVLAYTLRYNGEYIHPAAATKQNRKDHRKTVYQIHDSAMLKLNVEDQTNLF